MSLELQLATTRDTADLVALREAVNRHLASKFGMGIWIAKMTEKGALLAMRMARVYVARERGILIATLALSTRKPWAIDKSCFTESKRPIYLTNMAVLPGRQRDGIGSQCMEEAKRIARAWPGDSLRLDAYDAAAGAGSFYRNCGFREVGRVVYRKAPLIYYEMLLSSPATE